MMNDQEKSTDTKANIFATKACIDSLKKNC